LSRRSTRSWSRSASTSAPPVPVAVCHKDVNPVETTTQATHRLSGRGPSGLRDAALLGVPGYRLADARQAVHGVVLQGAWQLRAGWAAGAAGRCVRERLHAGGIRRRKPTPAERQMYKRPIPPPTRGCRCRSCRARSWPRTSWCRGRAGLGRLADERPSSSGMTRTRASGNPTVGDGSAPSPTTHPHPPRGLALHPGRRARGDRRRDQSLVAGLGLARIARRCGFATTAAASSPPPRSPAHCRQPLTIQDVSMEAGLGGRAFSAPS
jgi:hypothetical protein